MMSGEFFAHWLAMLQHIRRHNHSEPGLRPIQVHDHAMPLVVDGSREAADVGDEFANAAPLCASDADRLLWRLPAAAASGQDGEGGRTDLQVCSQRLIPDAVCVEPFCLNCGCITLCSCGNPCHKGTCTLVTPVGLLATGHGGRCCCQRRCTTVAAAMRLPHGSRSTSGPTSCPRYAPSTGRVQKPMLLSCVHCWQEAAATV